MFYHHRTVLYVFVVSHVFAILHCNFGAPCGVANDLLPTFEVVKAAREAVHQVPATFPPIFHHCLEGKNYCERRTGQGKCWGEVLQKNICGVTLAPSFYEITIGNLCSLEQTKNRTFFERNPGQVLHNSWPNTEKHCACFKSLMVISTGTSLPSWQNGAQHLSLLSL